MVYFTSTQVTKRSMVYFTSTQVTKRSMVYFTSTQVTKDVWYISQVLRLLKKYGIFHKYLGY